MCPGTIEMQGYRQILPVSAKWNLGGDPAGVVEVIDSTLVAHMKGRAYFGDSCAGGWAYNNVDYTALRLLGQRLRYTVDLSSAKCGCNAALYLTSMQQNSQKSECTDYYCDSANVCGVTCAEIDIQEANRHAWYSTLHTASDQYGMAAGYGATSTNWNASVYGPGARCIDTSQPFEVAAAFPLGADGKLRSLDVTLQQAGKPCDLSVSIGNYGDGMTELTQALQAGMTPIVSYWGISAHTEWLDGRGPKGQGPCNSEESNQCGDTVSFSAFVVEPLEPGVPKLEPSAAGPLGPVTTSRQEAFMPAAASTTRAPEDFGAPEEPSMILVSSPIAIPDPGLPGLPAIAIPDTVPTMPQPAGQPAAWEAVHPLVVAPVAPTKAAPPKAYPNVDRIVVPWVALAIGGLVLFGAMHYTQLWGGSTLKRYQSIEDEAQVGDEVVVRLPFVCRGRWMGKAPLESGTRGVILEAGRGDDTFVRFDKHSGQFRVPEDQLRCMEWRPRQRSWSRSPTSPSSPVSRANPRIASTA